MEQAFTGSLFAAEALLSWARPGAAPCLTGARRGLEWGTVAPGGGAIPGPTIGLLPLDDRPCNRAFPIAVARAAGAEVVGPPQELLGRFTRPGECEALGAWLRGCPAERLVVSLDMLCYGGLVAARSPAVSGQEAQGRLDALRELRRERPDCVVFGFSTIMRLGTTVECEAALVRHERLRLYSELVDRVERMGEERARPELEAVVRQLGEAELRSYLEVRRRCHAINRAAIGLLAEGVLDYLVLAQEDAGPAGLHVAEQVALRDQAREFRVADRVAVHPGADEVGVVLVARHLAAEAGCAPAMAVDYARAEGAEAIARYENGALSATVQGQMRAAGARPAAPGDAEAVLFVHTPIGPQQEAAEAPEPGHSPALALQAESLAERVEAAGEAGRLVGLADAAYANGADPELLAALGRAGAARRLSAYAGWNTAGNTVGTVVGHLCALAAARAAGWERDQAATERFLVERFVDDYGYQTRVRPRALEQARARGADPFALGEHAGELERWVRDELEPLAHELHSNLVARPGGPSLRRLAVSLPWARLFEVELGVELA